MPTIRRPDDNDELFELFFMIDDKFSALRIYLPNEFPLKRPRLYVNGYASHPWLDQDKRVVGGQEVIIKDGNKLH